MLEILKGVKVLEFTSIGPIPWAVYYLGDMGAEITSIFKPGQSIKYKNNPILSKYRNTIELDIKKDRCKVKKLISESDVLIEGMRPGVMDRLGYSPSICKKINPKLVYVRLSGWGNFGPYKDKVGHDINYLSISGALSSIGDSDKPVVPLNIVGDYGSGGMNLLLGILGGLFRLKTEGKGTLVDVSMLDGIFKQMSFVYQNFNKGIWNDTRCSNYFDGGAPWYSVYKTKDFKYMAVGALEDKFYLNFVSLLGLDIGDLPDRFERSNWEFLSNKFSGIFSSKTREHWCNIFENVDACVTPVLSLSESLENKHNKKVKVFKYDKDGNLLIKNSPIWTDLSNCN